MAQIPFSDYLSAHRALKNKVSANLLATLPEFDADGKPIPMEWTRLRFTAAEVPRLILRLADAVFEPRQVLLYGMRRATVGGTETTMLSLSAQKGLKE